MEDLTSSVCINTNNNVQCISKDSTIQVSLDDKRTDAFLRRAHISFAWLVETNNHKLEEANKVLETIKANSIANCDAIFPDCTEIDWEEGSRRIAERDKKEKEMLILICLGDWGHVYYKGRKDLYPKYNILGPRARYAGIYPGPPPPNSYSVSELDVEDPDSFQKLCEAVLEKQELVSYYLSLEDDERALSFNMELAKAHQAIQLALCESRFGPYHNY
jgi:hypothetical protein